MPFCVSVGVGYMYVSKYVCVCLLVFMCLYEYASELVIDAL